MIALHQLFFKVEDYQSSEHLKVRVFGTVCPETATSRDIPVPVTSFLRSLIQWHLA